MMSIEPGDWYYSPEHGELCRVIETQTLWGETACRVWLPGKDTIVGVARNGGMAAFSAVAHKILEKDFKLLMWYNRALTRFEEDG